MSEPKLLRYESAPDETRLRATQRLCDYVIKGFALDDQKLKEQATVGDYFDELLERIRD